MNIVGKKVRHNTDSNLGTGVVVACDGDIYIVRWQHSVKQFAGLSGHPREHLSFVSDGVESPPLANDPLTW